MANPSTVGPSGAGTEVLRRAYANNLSNSVVKIIDGVANHIYTVLTIWFHERANAAETLEMYVDIDDGGTTLNMLTNYPLAAYETFVWSDRFVITGTDALNVKTADSANVDTYVSFIDQDWT
jgi:hypothetical protein